MLIIKSVKFYQSIKFKNVERTWALNPKFNTIRNGDEDIQISVNDKGVLLENGNEATQVSWNNVAYVNYVKQEEQSVLQESEQAEQPKQQKVVSKKPTNFRDI